MAEVLASNTYPDMKPWVDLSPYLEPSSRSRFPSSCRAQIDGNNLLLAGAIVIESGFVTRVSNTLQILMMLPLEYRAGGLGSFPGTADGQYCPISTDSSGRLGIPVSAGIDPAECSLIEFSVILQKRKVG